MYGAPVAPRNHTRTLMNLYLIRHAESVNNARFRDADVFDMSLRDPDPALTSLGHVQAQHLAHFVAHANEPYAQHPHGEPLLTRLIVSPMRRALETARAIAEQTTIPIEVWDDVHEVGGIFDIEGDTHTTLPGMTRGDILALIPHAHLPPTITEQGWWHRPAPETFAEAHERAQRVAERLRTHAADHPEERLGVVSHGIFITLLLRVLLGAAFNDPLPAYFYHNNTGITRVEFIQPHEVAVHYTNFIGHVPGECVTY